jgi:hypothetical protein
VKIGKVARFLRDAGKANIRLLRDPAFRDYVRSGLGSASSTMIEREIAARELIRTPDSAKAFAGLARTSTALAAIDTGPGGGAVNLAIGQATSLATFAGIHTAITAAAELAKIRDSPLRLVTTDFSTAGLSRKAAEAELRERFGLPTLSLVVREDLGSAAFGRNDVWLASHWLTAHALQVASQTGVISPQQIAYLIQDYEPGFSAWSTEFVLARATYHAGFLPIVNSRQVAAYLRSTEGVEVQDELIFAPSLDLDRLNRASAHSASGGPVRVLFYSRPSKSRNLYRLGIAALREAARELDRLGLATEFYSAGEKHPSLILSGATGIKSLGKLDWDDYFSFLGTTHVLLSLQYSPHPSHPPLDAAVSGARAITNDFYGTRKGLHPGIEAVDATVGDLAGALVRAVAATDTSAQRRFVPIADGALGRPLAEVMAEASRRLDARTA